MVNFALLVRGPGGEQDPFGDGGLAGVYVGEDADVAESHGRCAFARCIRKGRRDGALYEKEKAVNRNRARSRSRAPEDTRITWNARKGTTAYRMTSPP
ncbi:hypothetical protein HerbRD11066_26040 [Herbidospora sp. RD11066]